MQELLRILESFGFKLLDEDVVYFCLTPAGWVATDGDAFVREEDTCADWSKYLQVPAGIDVVVYRCIDESVVLLSSDAPLRELREVRV